MKLRNKKTGEIGNLVLNINPNRESYSVLSTENGDTVCGNLVIADYDSLAELNEEWCDYEEPKDKGYWYIDDLCRMRYSSELLDEIDDRPNNWMIRKLCGNYFDTREEAEKAVEKLKAWKRLKDKRFRFCGWVVDHKKKCGKAIFKAKDYGVTMDEAKQFYSDLDLLFSGEDD